MAKYYILDGQTPVEVRSAEWSAWFHHADLRVQYDEIDGVGISTVFLGLSPSIGSGPPLIFETMIFPRLPSTISFCERTSTWEEAVRAHLEACLLVFEGTYKRGQK